jgi:hypothetical protein
VAFGFGSTAPEPPHPDTDLRILFIGNSLTRQRFARNGRAAGPGRDGKPPVVEAIAIGGFSLEDHWNRGDASRAIAGDKWDFVVLQQGPSALPETGYCWWSTLEYLPAESVARLLLWCGPRHPGPTPGTT